VISYNRAFLRMTGDYFFHCRARRSARAAVSAARGPVWRYLYTHAIANGFVDGVPISAFGAGHGLELLVLFRDHASWWQPTADELALSDTMMAAWRGLADTGSVPAGWPAYDAATDPYVVLDTPTATAAGVRSDACDFWDAHDEQ
jgi:carboxylesterase type B